MANPLFKALSGGNPLQELQQPAPAPSGSPDLGAGPSLFQSLQGQLPVSGSTQPLELGPEVADATGVAQNFINSLVNRNSANAAQPSPPPIDYDRIRAENAKRAGR